MTGESELIDEPAPMLTFVVGVCWYRIIPDRSRYKGNHRLLKRAKKPAAELVARGNGQRGEAAAFAKSCPPVKSIEAPAPTDEDSYGHVLG